MENRSLHRNKSLQSVTDQLAPLEVAGYIAKELLRRIDLSDAEVSIIKIISVFRLPIRSDIFHKVFGEDIDRATLDELTTRCVINYDGISFELHEAVRRYYYSNILKEELVNYHSNATLYYKDIYENQKYYSGIDPNIALELVYHLSLSGQSSEIIDLKVVIVEEIKTAARRIYKQHSWNEAIKLYGMLEEILPEDPEVLAYMGRCYARRLQWKESDKYFQHAIDSSQRLGQPPWWVFRDWGHMKSRYGFYTEAQEHLERAMRHKPYDPSIKASLAFLYGRLGEDQKAYEYYEEALRLNPSHGYSLCYFPKLLKKMEKHDYADILIERLKEIESGEKYAEPLEYDIEIDDE